jgi:hypothetical protein
MATLFLVDDNVTYKAVELQGESSWTVELFDNGTAGLTVDFLGLVVATSVTVVSKGLAGGNVSLGQLAEVPNDLTTVTIKGSEAFSLVSGLSGESNSGDGAVTDINAKAASATAIHSSLTLIDASATSGGMIIYAGATNTSSAGDFDNGASLNANITISYTGLTIEGGSGDDFIENDAKNGVVTDGNGHDTVLLGGADAKATLGTGTGDHVNVGISFLGTSEAAGSSLGDSVKFGSASTATLVIGAGAEAGSTAGTTSIGLTKVHDAAAGMQLDFSILTSSSKIVDESTNPTVESATTLTAAENAAVNALAGAGVAYFTFGKNEYFIATNSTEAAVSAHDAIVELVGVTNIHSAGISGGVVTLHV